MDTWPEVYRLKRSGSFMIFLGVEAEALRQSLDAEPEPVFKHGQLPLNPVAVPIISEFLEQCGLIEELSIYIGERVILREAGALQVKTERSTRLKYGEIGPNGLPAIKTDYLHIDSAGWPHLKVADLPG